MRLLMLLPMMIAPLGGCQRDAPPDGVFAGIGGDRLCIAGQRGGFIVYGENGANCAAVGKIEGQGTEMVLVPRGEGDCRISLKVQGDRVAIGPQPASCGYYCAPGTTFGGKSFDRADPATKATDFAGDPLC